MTLEVQFKLKSNPNYIRYIRENSYWYKILTRNPGMISAFEDEAKEKMGLRPVDKITKALDAMEMIQAVMSSLK